MKRWTDKKGDYIEQDNDIYFLCLRGDRRDLDGWLQPGVDRNIFRNRCYRAIQYGQTRTVEEIIFLQNFGRKPRKILDKASRHREVLATQSEWEAVRCKVLRKRVMTL